MKEISETALSVYNLLGIGENHTVHPRDIQNRTGLTPRAIRLAVDELQKAESFVLSSDKGYFKPSGRKDIERYRRRELGRMRSVQKNVKAADRAMAQMEALEAGMR